MDSAKWTDPLVNGQAGVIIDVVDGAARVDDKIKAANAAAGKDTREHYMDVFGAVTGSDGQIRTRLPRVLPAYWPSRSRV